MRMFKDSIHGYSALASSVSAFADDPAFPVPFYPKICSFIDTQVAASPSV